MGKTAKGLHPLKISKIGKKHNKKDEIKDIYMKILKSGIIGDSNYIGTSLNGLIQEV